MSPSVPSRVRPVRGHQAFSALRAQPARKCAAIRVRVAIGASPDVRVAYQIGRHFGNAVVRNRARRRLREAVRHCAVDLAPGDYLVIPQPAVLTMSFTELKRTVRDCMTHSVASPQPASPRAARS